MQHSTGKPTKVEQLRLDRIHAMACCACVQGTMAQPLSTEAHHLVDKGTRLLSGGHMATIPLDSWHHRGICLDYLTTSEMKFLYGPSLALHKREFVALYGSERSLLASVNRLMEIGHAGSQTA